MSWDFEPADITKDKYQIVCIETGEIIAQDVSLDNAKRICAMKEMSMIFRNKKGD